MTLRVAVWGVGPHARKSVLPAVASTPGLALAGVCSRDAETLRVVSAEYDCPAWNAPSAMLAERAVDVVFVATPTGLHAAHGLAVLEAGKHLWCEKPFTSSLSETESLLACSRERGLVAGEAFMYLHHPQFVGLSTMLRSGRLGYIHSLACRFGLPHLERPGFRVNAALGGGAFLDVGCYPISAMVALVEDDAPRVLFAEIRTAAGSEVDTSGRALLRGAGGVTMSLEWSYDVAYRNEIDAWGTEGSVQVERFFSKPADYVPRYRVLDRHGAPSEEPGSAGNHFVAMLSAFQGLVVDPAAAERERVAISRRARLADAIRRASQH